MSESITPVILTAQELELSYGQHVILNKATLSIHEGDRIGLIGRNGAGKSSFLKIIAGEMPTDYGNVAKRKDLIIGFLSQEFTLIENSTVYNNIINGAERIVELINKYESLPYDAQNRLLIEEQITMLDGWNLDKNIERLLKELNAPDKDKIVKDLSGGEKRRVALCRALIAKPDLLILDEPTNHLDTDSIEYIEEFLANYMGTCIFVTHDRYFLDRIANRIVELNNGVFFSHQGNYTDYLVNKSEREAIAEAEEEKRQNFLRRELQWVIRGPKARRTKSKSRLDKYYEVLEEKQFTTEQFVDLVVPEPEKLGNTVLNIKNLSVNIGNKTLFKNLNFVFEPGRKIGVVGKNGVGKTTLLKAIMGLIKPYNGEVEKGEKTEFNYIDQERLILDDSQTVIESIADGNDFVFFGKQTLKVWTYLRRFLFTDDRINTKVGRLSGGERSRLTLAKIIKKGGNFLLLDEPTNDLDLPTLRVLEEALIEFNGCLVIVSHDRFFLNRICNGILAFEDEGNLYFSEGNYDYYIEKKKLRLNATTEITKQIKPELPPVKQKPKKLTYLENKEFETIEERIIEAEEEVIKIEEIFMLPNFYELYSTKINELNKSLEEAKAKVKYLYDRWEELEQKKNNLAQ
ncbi:MAG TPA: ABC-F family ATP-binding cassette domain-containing protein [Melioribacteraceae bacterium]|nr:ABC-F family ATP-binding cassette domain-containing protein [Melioribacteraceae bacterium]